MKWVSRQHYCKERGVAVYLGPGYFSQGGWKAKAGREGFRKVVEQPSRPSTFVRPDRLVIVDEFRTSCVSSSVHARQPCELHLPHDRPRPADWVPPAGQVNQRLVRPAWSQRHAKYVRGLLWCHQVPPNPPPPPPGQAPPSPPPAQAQPLPAAPGPAPRPQAPPWGRWLDQDTNACLNFQRIGESMQRPLELCSWKDLEALPPVGDEYQQGYKLVNDRLPKVLLIWMDLESHAKQWAVKVVEEGCPRLAMGVVAAFQRRAEKHYSPAYSAAFVLDPANYKSLAPGTHPRPPLHILTAPQLQDVTATVARLSGCDEEDVEWELKKLKLAQWPDAMASDVKSIVAQTRTDEDGRTVAACISMRRNLWSFEARTFVPCCAEAAGRLLSMHVTTAAAERNWSSWGNTYDAGRAQLGIESAEKMVYIKANIPTSRSPGPSLLLAEGL